MPEHSSMKYYFPWPLPHFSLVETPTCMKFNDVIQWNQMNSQWNEQGKIALIRNHLGPVVRKPINLIQD